MKYAAFFGYILVIFLANWAITTFGMIPIGFGLSAPAGSLFAGLAFSLRDVLQDTGKRWWVLLAILIGALLTWFISIELALASTVAFLVSELVDLSVYTPLRKHGFYIALVVSNVVGLFADTLLFLHLANIPMQFATGQIVLKLLSIALFVLLYRSLTSASGYGILPK